MKTLTFLAICLLVMSGCKKSSDGTPSSQVGIQVEVSGLTAKTALNIKITDVTMSNIVILNLSNKFGNTTYTTSKVNPGDKLNIVYSTNIQDDLAGDGDGTVKLFYKGEQMGAFGGILSGTTTDTVPMP